MTQTVERRNRRTRAEILELVDQAEKLISNGLTKTKAAEQVGLSYPVLSKNLGKGIKAATPNDKVQAALQNLIQAVEEKVKRQYKERVLGL